MINFQRGWRYRNEERKHLLQISVTELVKSSILRLYLARNQILLAGYPFTLDNYLSGVVTWGGVWSQGILLWGSFHICERITEIFQSKGSFTEFWRILNKYHEFHLIARIIMSFHHSSSRSGENMFCCFAATELPRFAVCSEKFRALVQFSLFSPSFSSGKHSIPTSKTWWMWWLDGPGQQNGYQIQKFIQLALDIQRPL